MTQRKVISYKAVRDSHEEALSDLVITFCENPPGSSDITYDDMRADYQREGQKVVDALWEHLPGGLLDQILAALLLKKASLFRVPFVERRENETNVN